MEDQEELMDKIHMGNNPNNNLMDRDLKCNKSPMGNSLSNLMDKDNKDNKDMKDNKDIMK